MRDLDRLLKGRSIGALYAQLEGIDPVRLALLVELARLVHRMPGDSVQSALEAADAGDCWIAGASAPARATRRRRS